MIEVMRVVDYVLAFWQCIIFLESGPLKSKYPEEYSTVDKVRCENIRAEEILFRGVLRHYVSQNIDAITLNRFGVADSLCCMYSIGRFSQLLRCEVALHFINT